MTTTRKPKSKAAKPVMAWGGYRDGKLDRPWTSFGSDASEYAVYRTRKKARKSYEDVRRIAIVEVRR